MKKDLHHGLGRDRSDLRAVDPWKGPTKCGVTGVVIIVLRGPSYSGTEPPRLDLTRVNVQAASNTVCARTEE